MRSEMFSAKLLLPLLIAGSALVAQAGPAPAAPLAPRDIGYTAAISGRSVVITTDAGSLTVARGRLEVIDDLGRVAAVIPLVYRHDGVAFPIHAVASQRRAVLIPDRTPSPAPVADEVPQARPADALTNLPGAAAGAFAVLGLGTAAGGLIGTIIGASLGCVAGAVLGLPFAILPGAAGGCLAGMLLGGPAGAMIGTIVLGTPMLLAAGYVFFSLLSSPNPPLPRLR